MPAGNPLLQEPTSGDVTVARPRDGTAAAGRGSVRVSPFCGIALDRERNVQKATVMSPDTSRVTVRVICTDEDLMIATSVTPVLHLVSTWEA